MHQGSDVGRLTVGSSAWYICRCSQMAFLVRKESCRAMTGLSSPLRIAWQTLNWVMGDAADSCRLSPFLPSDKGRDKKHNACMKHHHLRRWGGIRLVV